MTHLGFQRLLQILPQLEYGIARNVNAMHTRFIFSIVTYHVETPGNGHLTVPCSPSPSSIRSAPVPLVSQQDVFFAFPPLRTLAARVVPAGGTLWAGGGA